MKVIQLFVCSFLLFLMAACLPDGQAVTEPTAVASELTAATSTPTQPSAPTATELPSPTATPPPAPSPTPPPAPSRVQLDESSINGGLPTLTPTAAPSPRPTATPTLPTGLTLLPGPDIVYEGVSLYLDPALSDRMYGRVAETFGVSYVVLQFDLDQWRSGNLVVTPVEDYLRYWEGPGPDPIRLQEALDNPEDDYFPVTGAHILLISYRDRLQFQDISGLRALIMSGQDLGWVASHTLYYNFYGLTADGRYHLRFRHPISASILIDNTDPDGNPDAIPLPPLPAERNEEWYDLVRDYNDEVARQLELLPGDAFTPNLDLLDALVASIRIDDPPYRDWVNLGGD